ncbi:MAG TPA: hypothetical protein VGN01_14705 [Acidobacteriaceae bacterium]|jgi:hypothetical protein
MTEPHAPVNGPIAAAVLSAGLGCSLLGVLAVAADGSKSLASALTFYRPTGPLSGVTTSALVFWLLCWTLAAARWKNKSVAFGKVTAFSFAFLALGLLLTFPPVGDLFLGR